MDNSKKYSIEQFKCEFCKVLNEFKIKSAGMEYCEKLEKFLDKVMYDLSYKAPELVGEFYMDFLYELHDLLKIYAINDALNWFRDEMNKIVSDTKWI